MLLFSLSQKSVTRVSLCLLSSKVMSIYRYIPPMYSNTLHSWTPKNSMQCICKKISQHHEFSQLIQYYLWSKSRNSIIAGAFLPQLDTQESSSDRAVGGSENLGVTSSNMVGIIYPLIEIGLIDPPKSK